MINIRQRPSQSPSKSACNAPTRWSKTSCRTVWTCYRTRLISSFPNTSGAIVLEAQHLIKNLQTWSICRLLRSRGKIFTPQWTGSAAIRPVRAISTRKCCSLRPSWTLMCSLATAGMHTKPLIRLAITRFSLICVRHQSQTVWMSWTRPSAL